MRYSLSLLCILAFVGYSGEAVAQVLRDPFEGVDPEVYEHEVFFEELSFQVIDLLSEREIDPHERGQLIRNILDQYKGRIEKLENKLKSLISKDGAAVLYLRGATRDPSKPELIKDLFRWYSGEVGNIESNRLISLIPKDIETYAAGVSVGITLTGVSMVLGFLDDSVSPVIFVPTMFMPTFLACSAGVTFSIMCIRRFAQAWSAKRTFKVEDLERDYNQVISLARADRVLWSHLNSIGIKLPPASDPEFRISWLESLLNGRISVNVFDNSKLRESEIARIQQVLAELLPSIPDSEKMLYEELSDRIQRAGTGEELSEALDLLNSALLELINDGITISTQTLENLKLTSQPYSLMQQFPVSNTRLEVVILGSDPHSRLIARILERPIKAILEQEGYRLGDLAQQVILRAETSFIRPPSKTQPGLIKLKLHFESIKDPAKSYTHTQIFTASSTDSEHSSDLLMKNLTLSLLNGSLCKQLVGLLGKKHFSTRDFAENP